MSQNKWNICIYIRYLMSYANASIIHQKNMMLQKHHNRNIYNFTCLYQMGSRQGKINDGTKENDLK